MTFEHFHPGGCFVCKGAGVRWNGDTCDVCDGSGKLEIPAREPSPESVTFHGVLAKTHEKYRCEKCDGSGICPRCKGAKRARKHRGMVDCPSCDGVTLDDPPRYEFGELFPTPRPEGLNLGRLDHWDPEIRELLEQSAAELEGWRDLGEIRVRLAPQASVKGLDAGIGRGPSGLCRSCRGTGSRNRQAEERELNALARQWDEEVRPQLRSRRPGGDPITPREDPFKFS